MKNILRLGFESSSLLGIFLMGIFHIQYLGVHWCTKNTSLLTLSLKLRSENVIHEKKHLQKIFSVKRYFQEICFQVHPEHKQRN